MNSNRQNSEHLVPGSAWTESAAPGAGIYFHAGRTHLVGHRSPAERRLLEDGALLIATLRFDRDPHECHQPEHAYQPLTAWQAVRLFCGHDGTS